MKKNIFNSRRFKHGSLATAMTVGFVAAVVLVNVIVGLLVERFPMNIDLTDNQIFELSDESIDYLKGVEQNVTINVLASESDFSGTNAYYNQANEVIKKYELYGQNIKVRYVDIYTDPEFVSNYPKEDLSYGNVVVDCDGRYQVLTAYDLFNTQTNSNTGRTSIRSSKAEQAMTSAVMFVTDANPMTVTVLNGYGSTNTTDIGNLTSVLRSNGYLVTETNLMTEDIAENVSIAILAAPTADLSQAEAQKLADFLENDGNFGRMLYYFADASQPKLPVLETLLEEWGIVIGDGYLMETDMNNMYMAPTALLQKYGDEESYKEGISEDVPVLMVNARPLNALWDASGNRYTHILFNTYSSAVVVPSDAGDDWNPNEDGVKDVYPTAILGQRLTYDGMTPKNSYVAAFSSIGMVDSYFLNMSALNNADYMVNLTNMLTNKEQGITIVSKTLGTESLGISQQQAVNIGALFQYALPVVILVIGAVVFIRRRNR